MGEIIGNAINAYIGYLKIQVQDLAGFVGGEAQSQRFVFDRILNIESALATIKKEIESKQVNNLTRIKGFFDLKWAEYVKGLDHGVGVGGGTEIWWEGEDGAQDKSLGFIARVEVTPGENCPDVEELSVWIYQNKRSGLIRGSIGYMNDGDEVVASGGHRVVDFTVGESWQWDDVRTMIDRVKSSIGVLEEQDETIETDR